MTAPAPVWVDPVERLAALWWVRWPRAVIGRFPSMWGIAGDGHALVALPPVAVLGPLLAVLGAFAVGAGTLGYTDVYTESVLFLAVMVALGAFSSQLGLLAVVAFAVGEQVLGVGRMGSTAASGAGGGDGGTVAHLLQVRLPQVITYLLLAVAVVVVPRTARALLVAVGRWRRVPPALAWPLASGLFVVVVWLALSTWVAAAPTLVRPRFTWSGGVPTVEAIAPIQEDGDEIVAAGVLAAIARQVLLGLAMWWPPVRDRVRRAEQTPAPRRVAGAGRARPVAAGPVRRLAGDVVSAVLATLVLAGVLERVWLWVAAFSVFLGIRLLRSGVVSAGALDGWKVLAARIPAALRVVVLWVVARVLTDALVRGVIDSYTGIAVFVMGGAVVVFLLFPGPPRRPAGPVAGPDADPAPAGGS